MITREKYEPRINGMSSQNEPGEDLILEGNVRRYPDMYYAYEKFRSIFNLPKDCFFLANGCENAMKNVLLALKPRTMLWAVPTWRMPVVYAAALGFRLITKEFEYKDNEGFSLPQDYYNTEADVLYDNLGITTCFTYKYSLEDIKNSKASYNIIDLTYKSFFEMRYLIPILRENPKNIIIGSFDKMAGGGLRLGFAIFDKSLKDSMALQREQYINMLAYNWLIDTDFKNKNFRSKFYAKLEKLARREDFLTDNFLTIKGDISTTIPCYKFKSKNGEEFTRFGIPNSEEEFRALEIVLNHYFN